MIFRRLDVAVSQSDCIGSTRINAIRDEIYAVDGYETEQCR
jgi:hypothetical protein